MSDPDIVEILRANCTGDCVNVRSIDLVPCYVCEASNKIEELQEKNEWLESHVGALIIGFRENKAEIERLREENTELKDARIDLRAVENIVSSVQDLLLAARRQYDIQVIQNELFASKDAEIERLRQLGDKLAMHLDAFFGMLEPASNEIAEVLKEWKEARRG